MKKYIYIPLISAALIMSGCSLSGSNNGEKNNNSADQDIIAQQNTSIWPYTFPEDIYPEQVSQIIKGEDSELYALVDVVNKYRYPEAIVKYDLSENPVYIDNYAFLGLLESTDEGKTWTKVFTFIKNQDHDKFQSLTTCKDASSEKVVYLFFRSSRASGGLTSLGAMHIYISQDGATTWSDQGIFALKNGNELDIVSALNKSQTEVTPISFEILENFSAKDGNCAHVEFSHNDGKDIVSSENYGKTWTRTKTE